MERLSSLQTFLMKFIFPVVWISGFGLGVMQAWLNHMPSRTGEISPESLKLQFLIMWVVGSVLVLWCGAGLKKVRKSSNNLYISNYLKEIIVPLSEIQYVKENRWLNIHPVTIYFKNKNEFGSKIVFMPKIRFFGLFSPHPVVEKLTLNVGKNNAL